MTLILLLNVWAVNGFEKYFLAEHQDKRLWLKATDLFLVQLCSPICGFALVDLLQELYLFRLKNTLAFVLHPLILHSSD